MACGRLNNGPQRYQVLIPGTCKCYLMWQRFCKFDWVKDLEIGKLCQIIWVRPKCNHNYPYKRGRGRFEDQQRKRRQHDHESRDWSDVATSQGMLAATRSWKRQVMDSLLEPLEGTRPCQQLILAQWYWFQTSRLQNCEGINMCCCRTPYTINYLW